jgi:group II intron reverse transcriptase/maturase
MMNERGKSDPGVVAAKPANKAEPSAAEPAERRAGTKGNADQQHTGRTQSRETLSQVLARIRRTVSANEAEPFAAKPVERGAGNANQQHAGRPQGRETTSQTLERIQQTARLRKKERFTALYHHINLELLESSFFALKREAAPGVDGMTWQGYAANLGNNIKDLHARVQRGAYRALPSRRQYIPKPDGRQRPLAVAALEDKIVQRATATVLNAIYEEDFLGFSYGFRPGRGAHDAMDALVVGIESRKVNWILDADIRSFFDTISQEWLIRFLEHRIGDPRIIRLIQKWLKAGILEDGAVTVSEVGTAQGSVISPLLANIYLFYVLDLFADRWRRREAKGDVIIVRYADDFIVGFEHETDARRFLDLLRERMEKFALALHPEKTRLIEFGRYAAANRRRRGLGKPETFNFLGFTFMCGISRRGRFLVKRKSRRDRMRAKLQAIKQELRQRILQPIREQGKWLKQVVGGYFRYHAVPTNSRALKQFRDGVATLWRQLLRRRSQKADRPWTWFAMLVDHWLPRPKIQHLWPRQRFDATHPR